MLGGGNPSGNLPPWDFNKFSIWDRKTNFLHKLCFIDKVYIRFRKSSFFHKKSNYLAVPRILVVKRTIGLKRTERGVK